MTAASAVVEMWARRLVTLPLYTALCVCVVGTLPVLLGSAALIDLVRRAPWVMVRCVAFFTVYLLCEVVGIIASGALWLTSGLWLGRDPTAYLRRNLSLQRWWAGTLFKGVQLVFGLRTEVEGDALLSGGPFIVFIRHASVGDTLLPAVLISNRHAINLRYVLKRELLWDPCLDIVGNRLPNCFIRRGSGDSEREIRAIEQLMEDLGPTDGVLIYPEGTRFTAAKREHVLERIAQAGDAALLARARALRHVLPPRLGGPLALLERNQNADVIFCAHVGFDGMTSFRELFNGILVHRLIRVRFWRVPFAALPTDRAARTDWLYDWWAQVDAWVGAQAADRTRRLTPWP